MYSQTYLMTSTGTYMNYHPHIKQKLDNFYLQNCIPNLLFHGKSGTGKRSMVYHYIHQIYQRNKEKLKTNVMFVNCAHGKGIKFIREEVKFFAKSNLKGKQGVSFKTIVLFNADNLTIDAQSALRRCIELFSYNTRFFIIIEDKNKLLNPILSRFCEIHVPEIIDGNKHPVNLHQYYLEKSYGFPINPSATIKKLLKNYNHSEKNAIQLASQLYEEGLSALDIVDYIKSGNMVNDLEKTEIVMEYHKIRSEFKNEKLLLYYLLRKIPFR